MTLLFINCCARENSRTKILADYWLKDTAEEIIEIDPLKEEITGLDGKTLAIRDKALREKDFSHPVLKWAVQFAKADNVVIAAPYWDLSFPASLKNYIERINCTGVTFDYDENGQPYGLCTAKNLVYITTAGGPVIDEAYGYGYIRALCENFYHIPETVCFCAENLDMPFTDVEAALKETEKQMDAYKART